MKPNTKTYLLFPDAKGEALITTLIDNAITLIYLLKAQIDTESNTHLLTQEYAYRFFQLFNQLKQLQEQYGYIDSVKTLYQFY